MTEDEFDAFYTASFARVTSQVHAMIGDREEAQDCVQEAFAKLWAQRRRMADVNRPEAWVRTVAYRMAVSRWRRLRLARRAPDRALQPEPQQSIPDERHVALVEALKQLPEAQRRALVLHHLCDLPVAEVAIETQAPEGTVKARLARGRTALLALLDPGHDSTEGAAHV